MIKFAKDFTWCYEKVLFYCILKIFKTSIHAITCIIMF